MEIAKGPFCQSCSMPMDRPDCFGTNANNACQVYVSSTDATSADERVTLNPGEAIRLSVTNSNLIHVAAANAGDRIDMVAEQ